MWNLTQSSRHSRDKLLKVEVLWVKSSLHFLGENITIEISAHRFNLAFVPNMWPVYEYDTRFLWKIS
jgi:hypothetical protein